MNRSRRSTIPTALLLASLMIFGAVACGGDEQADETTELQSDGEQENSDSTESTSGDDSSDEESSSSGDDSTSIPDLDDFDMGNLEECMSIGVAYAGLALSALGGEEEAKKAFDELEDLGTKFPAELEDDLAVVAEAYRTIAEEGIIDGSDAMESDEFNEADANIQKYLEETCGGS